MCRFNTPPCVHSKRPRVCRQHAHTCFNMCARAAGIHGDVLNVQTESVLSLHTGFSACHTTPHTQTHTQQHTETETEKKDRERREREKEKEKENENETEKETEKEKRRRKRKKRDM